MPELPEVETVKNGIEKFIGKAKIHEAEIYNRHFRNEIPSDFEAHIHSATITGYRRRGKYIIIDLDNKYSIIWHLGMSGRVKTMSARPDKPEKHDHVIIHTSAGVLIFNDPRRFGFLSCCPTADVERLSYFRQMGIEPFDRQMNGLFLREKFRQRKTPIKTTLLNQSIVTGIGNIYASEILFEAKIAPQRPAATLSSDECNRLADSIRKILQKAIDNGGSTLHDYHKPDGSLGYFQNLHCVYNKTGQRCPDCTCGSGAIRKIVQDGRSTFYCPEKQK